MTSTNRWAGLRRANNMSCAQPISLDTVASYARDRVTAAMDHPKDGLIRREFAMPLLDLTVWFSGQKLADLCESRLVFRAGNEPADNRAEILALDPGRPDWPHPAVWPHGEYFTTRLFEKRFEGAGLRGFYHHGPASWQIFDPESGLGVFAMADPMGIPPWESGSPLRLFLHWAHARKGRRLTHAAAVGLENAGALVVGSSGSGKSGTALAALLNGLKCAGDDYVVVESGETITAHAAFRVFKQDSGGLARSGLDAGEERWGPPNWHGKHEFDAMALAPAGFARQLPIRAILLPKIAHLARTEIDRVPVSQAVIALAPSAIFQLQGDTDSGMRFFSDLARRLPAFRVRLSDNPEEIAHRIGEHLAREFADAG